MKFPKMNHELLIAILIILFGVIGYMSCLAFCAEFSPRRVIRNIREWFSKLQGSASKPQDMPLSNIESPAPAPQPRDPIDTSDMRGGDATVDTPPTKRLTPLGNPLIGPSSSQIFQKFLNDLEVAQKSESIQPPDQEYVTNVRGRVAAHRPNISTPSETIAIQPSIAQVCEQDDTGQGASFSPQPTGLDQVDTPHSPKATAKKNDYGLSSSPILKVQNTVSLDSVHSSKKWIGKGKKKVSFSDVEETSFIDSFDIGEPLHETRQSSSSPTSSADFTSDSLISAELASQVSEPLSMIAEGQDVTTRKWNF